MDRLKEAQKLYNAGKFKEAEALYRDIAINGSREERGHASSILFILYEDKIFSNGNEEEQETFFTRGVELGSPLALFYVYMMDLDIQAKEYEVLVKELKKMADDGCNTAMQELARMYEIGKYRKQDDRKALQWYEKAAREGDVMAFFNAALILMDEKSKVKDLHKGYLYMLKAASLGYSRAEYALGFCFFDGKGVAKDREKALILFQKAAEHGENDACMKLWDLYSAGIPDENGIPQRDLEKGFTWLKMAAERGYKPAAMNMGMCYLNGYGTEIDGEKALYWYQKARDEGNTMAGAIIGTMYVNGVLGEGREEEGISLLKEAAREGSLDALRELGFLYLEGKGIHKDEKEGLRLLQEAADEGDSESYSRMGIYYLRKKDNEKALSCFRKAAERGDASGEFHLAFFYIQGIIVPKNIRKGITLLQRAKEKGFYEAEKLMADIIKEDV